MQIAVTAARETVLPASQEDRPYHGKSEARIGRQPSGFRCVEEIGAFGEGGVVLLDICRKRLRGPRGVSKRRARVRTADGKRQLVDHLVRQGAPRGDLIKRCILVEAPHMGDPFDDVAIAADRKRLA